MASDGRGDDPLEGRAGRGVVDLTVRHGASDAVGGPEDRVHRGVGDRAAGRERCEERIERADALVLVLPVYWWHAPALLKGWIDRVFQYGWAYGDEGGGPVRGEAIAALDVHLVGLAQADAGVYGRHGYADSLRVGIEHGIFECCGGRVSSSRLVHWADGDAGRAADEAAAAVVAEVGRARAAT